MQVVYDIETYPNYFCLGAVHLHSDYRAYFECSEFRDDSEALFEFLDMCARNGVELIGFNSLGFDYPVIHHLIRYCQQLRGAKLARAAYDKAEQIIRSQDRFASMIWASDRFIPQIDLYKMNHFDNMAKSTSLKALQFAMRAASVEDLPIAPGTIVTQDEATSLGLYCMHDVDETKAFAIRCAPEIEFRRSMQAELGDETLNWSDVKLGSEYMIAKIGKDKCYYRDEDNKRQPCQTQRSSIPVAGILFPYIKFERPECVELLERFRSTVITNTKAAVSDCVVLDGFAFHFGAGGVHGSVDRRAFRACDDYEIVDADVTSLYPSIAIENNLFPEHLGTEYVAKYRALKEERKKYAKGTPRNAAIKLALNGTYGNSNNPWSPFYDPRYTMATTINGQLLLLMLAERLLAAVPGLGIIQINTDGITCTVPGNGGRPLYDAVCAQWARETRLDLEFVQYAAFFCRDVNNYIAVGVDGKTKRKGAYEFPEKPGDYNGWWHKDWSALVVQRAVSAALVDGVDVETFIAEWEDPFDFMLRAKTPRSSQLMLGGVPQQRITRYYLATDGAPLVKESPPVEGAMPGQWKRRSGITDALYFQVLRTIPAGTWDERIHTKNRSVYADRTMKIAASAAVCNRATDFDWTRVDRAAYVAEARKLVDCFSSPA